MGKASGRASKSPGHVIGSVPGPQSSSFTKSWEASRELGCISGLRIVNRLYHTSSKEAARVTFNKT